ncbi:uncharacterized protein DNG_04782 [Cephalotrichum gorgonifer]|uniref:Uncharacterized protein n=1 Tax=Cephalotrichum gorgonifer TaxID=2041049 RepID=A0AAE8MYR7_9PEZI|nr:uncharacterized protein DNG_04782 [Cephalotrichum gorgonifer]
MPGADSSAGSGNEEDLEAGKKRQPGVKRACNECRQQKRVLLPPGLVADGYLLFTSFGVTYLKNPSRAVPAAAA